MAEETKGAVYNLTASVVMTFPNLLAPRKFGKKGKESGDPKYSASFSLTPDSIDLKAMKALAAQVAKAKWPGRPFVDPSDKTKNLLFPFTSGDKLADAAKAEKKDKEFYRGKIIMASRSKYQPRLYLLENPDVALEGDALKAAGSKFYSGVLVLAQFNFVAYPGVGHNPDGVTAYLNMVMSTNRGAKLGSTGPSAAEAFKGYIGTVSAEDPTGGEFAAPADDGDEIPV